MPPAGPPALAPVASRAAEAVVMALLSHTERALWGPQVWDVRSFTVQIFSDVSRSLCAG